MFIQRCRFDGTDTDEVSCSVGDVYVPSRAQCDCVVELIGKDYAGQQRVVEFVAASCNYLSQIFVRAVLRSKTWRLSCPRNCC